MAKRQPFEYATGCTGPAVDTDIVPDGLPVCDEPEFETPETYVSKVDSPDVQPPPCPASEAEAGYFGMWKVSANGNDKIDVFDSADETRAGTVTAREICSGDSFTCSEEDIRELEVPDEFLHGTSAIGYVVAKFKIDGVPAVLQPDPGVPDNISVLNKTQYDAAVAALSANQRLPLLALVWTVTDGGALQIQQEQYGPIETDIGGNCANSCNAVACRITGGAGPMYAVDIYANGPGNAATGTGTLFVMQMLVLNSLAIGTWVLGSEAELGVLGETP